MKAPAPSANLPAAGAASRPVRLGLVITELAPGGAERCLVEIATRLDRRRFAPVVYSLQPPPAPDRQILVERLQAAEVPIRFLDMRWAWQAFGAVSRLAAQMQADACDVVQTFLFHANVLGAQAAARAGVRRVVCGMRVADPRPWRVAVERFATRHAARWVCVSQSVAEFYARRGFPRERLVVIPNGIDVARWENARPARLDALGVPDGRAVILFVGRLDRQKGLDAFLPELRETLRALPRHDLLIVGEGPERGKLESLARRLGIAERVHFAGWQTQIPEFIAASELVFLPSRWEGMPNVILEAMASGKAVVASRVEGVVELLGPDAAKQTAEANDWQGLADRLRELSCNQLLQKELGVLNRARAEGEFSVDAMVARYAELYETLVNGV